MTRVFALFVAVHGLIHLLGFAKAFRLAELPQLTRPVSPAMGLLWLVAALLFVAAAGALLLWPRWWWAIGAVAIGISLIAIVPSWADAKFGALADIVVLAGVIVGLLVQGPLGLRSQYERDVERGLARATWADTVTDNDLASLPPPVQHYLRAVGVVGQRRVRSFRARLHGRIRSGRDARWMPLRAEQYNFYDEPARLFYLNASMLHVPVEGYHRYVDAAATMRVRAAGVVPLVNASGAEMTQTETVTLFNDMCVFAPATLIDPAIRWEDIDAHRARATFTNRGHTIQAELVFGDAGELVNFWSDDRAALTPDGKTMTRTRWSTPLERYRAFGPVRLASRGQARWHEAGGEYAYIELEIDDVQYNLTRP